MTERVQAMVFEIEVDATTGQARLKTFQGQAHQAFDAVSKEGAKASGTATTLGGKIGDLNKRATELQGGLRGAATQTGGLSGAMQSLGHYLEGIKPSSLLAVAGLTAVVGIILEAGHKFKEFIDDGEKEFRLAEAFGTLTKRIGVDAEALEAGLKKAALGLVDDSDLMQAANKAIQLQLPVTTESFTKLAEAAVLSGRALGQGPLESIEKLVQGLAAHQERVLRSIGVTIDFDQANKELAKSLGIATEDLTEVQKREAGYTAAMKSMAASTADLQKAAEVLTLSNIFTRIAVDVKNASNAMAVGFNLLPEALKNLGQALEHPVELLKNLSITGSLAGAVGVTLAAHMDKLTASVNGFATVANFDFREKLGIKDPGVILTNIATIESGIKQTKLLLGEAAGARRSVLAQQLEDLTSALHKARIEAGLDEAPKTVKPPKIQKQQSLGFGLDEILEAPKKLEALNHALDELHARQTAGTINSAQFAEGLSRLSVEGQRLAELGLKPAWLELENVSTAMADTGESALTLADQLAPALDQLDALAIKAQALTEIQGLLKNAFIQTAGAQLGAALAGEKTSGLLKRVLADVAKEAAVKSLFELAEAFSALAGVYTAGLAPGHFKAAAAWGATAVAAGGASRAAGGGGGGRASAGSGGGGGGAFGTQPSFQERQLITLGNPFTTPGIIPDRWEPGSGSGVSARVIADAIVEANQRTLERQSRPSGDSQQRAQRHNFNIVALDALSFKDWLKDNTEAQDAVSEAVFLRAVGR